MTPEEELARWERVCIEPNYMVWDAEVNDRQKDFAVVDAECVYICYCDTREMAEVVAAALDMYDDAMVRLRCPSDT